MKDGLMAKFVLLGLAGEAGLSLIDLESGAVEKVSADSVDEAVAKVRKSGAAITKGVDLAIAVEDRQDAVGRFFFDGGAVR